MLRVARDAGRAALANTRVVAVLKDAGVVDAGAQGSCVY